MKATTGSSHRKESRAAIQNAKMNKYTAAARTKVDRMGCCTRIALASPTARKAATDTPRASQLSASKEPMRDSSRDCGS
jgi:hypothetical protein